MPLPCGQGNHVEILSVNVFQSAFLARWSPGNGNGICSLWCTLLPVALGCSLVKIVSLLLYLVQYCYDSTVSKVFSLGGALNRRLYSN